MNQRGFTIVELLVVIVVIAILAAITIVGFNGVQRSARDSERKTELSIIQKYVEMYIGENGFPPATIPGCYAARSLNASGCESFSTLPKVGSYLGNGAVLPIDPLNNADYNYQYRRGAMVSGGAAVLAGASDKDYVIVTRLENDSSSFTFSGGTYNYFLTNRQQ